MRYKNLISKQGIYLYLVAVIFSGCDFGTEVKQEYFNNYLITKAKYKSEIVWAEYDDISLNTNDSIKCIRRNQGEEWIKKFKTIDEQKCR